MYSRWGRAAMVVAFGSLIGIVSAWMCEGASVAMGIVGAVGGMLWALTLSESED